MLQNDLGLADLVNLEEWQKIQDSFAEVQEITLRIVSPEGTPLSKISRPSRICAEILPKIPSAGKICLECFSNDASALTKMEFKQETTLKCPFGLEVVVIPVVAMGGRIVAYVIIGPVILKARGDKAYYAEQAKRWGIDVDELMDGLIDVSVFSYNKLRSITNLVRDMTTYMAQTGYHKKRLAEIAPEIIKMDPLFSRYYEEKILNALLHACALALNADSGSVMTVDKSTNMLHIKVASKLDDNIVTSTNIKVGEGIAGLAAARHETIILPKDMKKNHLSDKMKRSYIKSSMIVPFNKGNAEDVYGVINLNMVRKTVDFSEKDIAVVKELVNMASVALIPLQESSPVK